MFARVDSRVTWLGPTGGYDGSCKDKESWHYRDGGGGKNEPAPKPDPESSSEPPAMRIKVGDTVTYYTAASQGKGIVSEVLNKGVALDSGRSIQTIMITGVSRA